MDQSQLRAGWREPLGPLRHRPSPIFGICLTMPDRVVSDAESQLNYLPSGGTADPTFLYFYMSEYVTSDDNYIGKLCGGLHSSLLQGSVIISSELDLPTIPQNSKWSGTDFCLYSQPVG